MFLKLMTDTGHKVIPVNSSIDVIINKAGSGYSYRDKERIFIESSDGTPSFYYDFLIDEKIHVTTELSAYLLSKEGQTLESYKQYPFIDNCETQE